MRVTGDRRQPLLPLLLCEPPLLLPPCEPPWLPLPMPLLLALLD